MKHYLFDASAFLILIKKADIQATAECLKKSYVLDLTFYEVGNAIWKESTLTKLLTPVDSKTLEKATQTILAKTDRITGDAETFQKILEIAKKEKLSFYDSSYIYFAKERRLALVTEDKELKTKAQRHVDVRTVATLVSS
jgi:predicted nucleic acid-binding protein